MDSRSLRGRIGRHRRSAPYPHRYPEDLREEIVRHARGRQADGESVEAVATRLGMSPFTLYEWLRRVGRRSRGFRRVQVESPPAGPVSLVTPAGYWLEGKKLEREERRGARGEPHPLRVGEEPPLGDERPVAVEEEGVEERAPPHFRPTAFRIASVNDASVVRPERREETFPSRP